RPHPRRPYRGCVYLQDSADYGAIGKHVIVVIVPLARRTRGGRAFEDQRRHLASHDGNDAGERRDDACHRRYDGPYQDLPVPPHRLLFDPGFLITQPPLNVTLADGLRAEATDGCGWPAGALCQARPNDMDASGFKRTSPSSLQLGVRRMIIFFATHAGLGGVLRDLRVVAINVAMGGIIPCDATGTRISATRSQ